MDAVSVHDLKLCDVLLSRGTGTISHLIVLFDGGTYGHSTLCDGQDAVEAIASGVTKRPLPQG